MGSRSIASIPARPAPSARRACSLPAPPSWVSPEAIDWEKSGKLARVPRRRHGRAGRGARSRDAGAAARRRCPEGGRQDQKGRRRMTEYLTGPRRLPPGFDLTAHLARLDEDGFTIVEDYMSDDQLTR